MGRRQRVLIIFQKSALCVEFFENNGMIKIWNNINFLFKEIIYNGRSNDRLKKKPYVL